MPGTRPRIALLIAGLIVTSAVLGAWQWPVDDFSIDVSFAEPRDGGLTPGLQIVAGADPVRPAAEGELVFAMDAAAGSSRIPHGLGSFVVLQHEGGFRSLYAHLQRDHGLRMREFAESDTLGAVGLSGFAGGNTLGFRIIDAERDAYVNPMILLPELEDGTAPRITDVVLTRGQSTYSVSPGARVPTGPARLRARIYDPGSDGPYRGDGSTYSVVVFVNGQQQFDLALETLRMAGGEVMITDEHAAADLYDEEGRFRLGRVDIAPGGNLIEIITEDHAGNERMATFQITGASEQ